jgi:Uma2 family endonuclease
MEGGTVERAVSESQQKLTVEEFDLLPTDDGQRHELIDGEHVVTPAPFVPHQRLLGKLHVAVFQIVEGQALGEVFFAPLDVVLSRHDVLQPDLLFRDIIGNRVTAAPDLAVEVLSVSSRRTDELRKRARYERFGVEELWIFDPDIDGVRVYRRPAAGEPFGRAVQMLAEAGDALESPLLPGLRLPLTELFS